MTPAPQPCHVALFGECMIELQGQAFGTMQQTFGGDTLNTAVYLARCGRAAGIRTWYATALGDDNLSSGMVQRWADEGIGLDLVRRLPGRRPGLYLIDVDAQGERSFSYWREASAARDYFGPEPTPLEQRLPDWQAIYLSGISLAILPPAGRERLFMALQALRARGARVVFDNNYRPRLWPDAALARQVFARALGLADLAFVTEDDHQALMALPSAEAARAHAQALAVPELVIKRGAAPTLVRSAGQPGWLSVPTDAVPRVVDTTAAGDAFAAGYLSRRLAGASAHDAARFGNRLAARVIQHRGALVPLSEMADLVDAPLPDRP